MMLSAIGREFSRQLSEYKQFKVNLLFANLGIFFLVTGFLNYFDSQQDTFELFILLFTWYFSSHSITHPTYFIEDEIADRTIINVIQSRRSIFGMLFYQNYRTDFVGLGQGHSFVLFSYLGSADSLS